MYHLLIPELSILRALCVIFFYIKLAINSEYLLKGWAVIAQSVQRLAMGWTVRRSSRGGGEIFHTHPDWPWGPPSLQYNGHRVFPGGSAVGTWC